MVKYGEQFYGDLVTKLGFFTMRTSPQAFKVNSFKYRNSAGQHLKLSTIKLVFKCIFCIINIMHYSDVI